MNFREIGIVVVALLVGAAIGLVLAPRPTALAPYVQVIDRPFEVQLTRARLDSLRLAFIHEFKATSKFEAKQDSLKKRVSNLEQSIRVLNDSLSVVGSYTLEYHSESLGKYSDTLDVVCNVANELIFVDFRPTERKFEIPARLDSIVYIPVIQEDSFINHPVPMLIILGIGIMGGIAL
jgi:hypothetical protein